MAAGKVWVKLLNPRGMVVVEETVTGCAWTASVGGIALAWGEAKAIDEAFEVARVELGQALREVLA